MLGTGVALAGALGLELVSGVVLAAAGPGVRVGAGGERPVPVTSRIQSRSRVTRA